MNYQHLLRGVASLALTLAATLGVHAQQSFNISGQIGKDHQGMLTFKYADLDKTMTDSVKVENGKFNLKGKINEPGFASLYYAPADKSKKGEYKEMFLDPMQIDVTSPSSLSDAAIKGGPSMTDFESLMKLYAPIQEKGGALDKAVAKAREEDDQEKLKTLWVQHEALTKERAAIQQAFAKSHPNSYVGFNLWLRKLPGVLNPAVIEPEFNAFSAKIRSSFEGKKVAAKLAIAKQLVPGKMAPNFTLTDTAGKAVSLSDMKGKNVVLVFWARNYVPFEPFSFAMIRMSKQLKNENVLIVPVYFESGSYDWKNVLQESSMVAGNIINLKASASLGAIEDSNRAEIVQSYGLTTETGIHAYLISPDGKILIRGINLVNDPAAEIKTKLK